jgi:general stress protein 26
MNDKQKHYRDVLDSFNTAMLCTLGDDGVPRSRPMQVADIDDENRLWFFTNLKSEKIAEIEADSTVGITMQGGESFFP